jgi:metallo-beta-lactamase family protein
MNEKCEAMKLSFLGGAGVVTGANYLLETATTKILIDCGLFQGGRAMAGWNERPFRYSPKDINAVFVTHAHLDHTGRLPILYKEGFRGRVIATPPTRDLAAIILADTEEMMHHSHGGQHRGRLFNKEDVRGVMERFEVVPYKTRGNVGDIAFVLQDAGHILGSSMVELFVEGKKVLFTGDLGNSPSPLLQPTAIVERADYVIIESSYAGRTHEPATTRIAGLERIVEQTVKKRGVLLVPAFALERTQELLYDLNVLVEDHRIPRIPIFVDSPMAIEALSVYKRYSEYFSEEGRRRIMAGDELFRFPGLKLTQSKQDSDAIAAVPAPKMIIAGNGMSSGGRIVYHEQRYLGDSKNQLLIVSYQVNGTPGRELSEGKKLVRIAGKEVDVRARVEVFTGYSGHADHSQLLSFLSDIERPVKHVFAVQGESENAQQLTQEVRDRLGIPASVPQDGESVEL